MFATCALPHSLCWLSFLAVCGALVGTAIATYRQVDLQNERIAALDLAVADLAICQPEPTMQQKLLDLPDDASTWHTLLFVRPDWRNRAEERKIHTMFQSDPCLVSLRQETHWHLVTTDSQEFAPFARLVDATPCLLIERANGQVIYRESGPQLGLDSTGLRRAIRREVERHCPDGRCLPLHPLPADRPAEPAAEVPEAIRQPAAERKSPLAPLLAAIGGLAAGGVAQWKRTG